MTDTARPRTVTVRWFPIVVFVLAAAAMMPLALMGVRAFAPVDVVAQSSPYRDQAVRPVVVNPVQNDVPEAQAVQWSFWNDARHGRFQLWSHATGAGVPTGALPFSALTAPLSLPYLFTPRWYAPGLRAFATLLTAQWGLYLLARRLRLAVVAATVAGVAFAFSGSELIMLQRVGAAAVAPWVIWSCLRIVEAPTARRAAAFAAIVAWSWLEGFAAATLFTLYVAAAWTAWVVVVERPRAGDGSTTSWTRWTAHRAAAFAGGGAVAGLLVAFQALPFSAVVRNSGLLETRRFDGHFAIGPYGLFAQVDNAVIGGLKGPWVSVANSFEGIGLTGSIALAGAALALALLAAGRLRVPGVAARTAPFLGLAAVVMVVLCYSGGRLLDLAYALPGMRSNTIYRHRWFIPLLCSLLLAVALDHLWRVAVSRTDDAEERWTVARWARIAAGATLVAAVVVVARAVPTFRQGLHAFDRTGAVVRAFAWAAVAMAIAFAVAMAPARLRWRSPHATAATAGTLAALVWVQLAVPMHDWIPQVSVRRYYSSTTLHDDLRRLAGQRWRFLGTGEYTPYLNAAAVEGLLDVRTTPVLDRQYRDVVQAGLPTAFAADNLKMIVAAADVDMRSPVLDELSVRYVVVGTDQPPLGDAEDPAPPTAWVPAAQAGALAPRRAAGGVAGVGVALRAIPAGPAARTCRGFVRVSLASAGREIGSARRPAWDVATRSQGADLTVAIAGGDDVATDAPVTVSVSVEEGSCPALEVGTIDDHAAARLFSTPVDGAWRVATTNQGWVYERPSAKPLVRVDAGEVVSSVLVSNGVRATVRAARNGTVTVAENDDPGWRLHVNGRRVTPLRVDGALIGVPVGPGVNDIRLDYVPQGFAVGRLLSALGLVGLAALVWAPALIGRARTHTRTRRRRPLSP